MTWADIARCRDKMGAEAIYGDTSLWHPATSHHITPCVNNPVDFFVTRFQWQSHRDITPCVNTPLDCQSLPNRLICKHWESGMPGLWEVDCPSKIWNTHKLAQIVQLWRAATEAKKADFCFSAENFLHVRCQIQCERTFNGIDIRIT